MARETVGLKIDIDSRSAATAARRMDDLGAAGGRVGRGLKVAGAAFAAIGIAATVAAGAILRMTMQIAEQADEIGKTSRGLGITTTAYQDLSHALDLSGSSIEGAAGGFRRLSANLLDAQQGVLTAVDAFGELGVEAQTAEGEMRSFDAVLGDIADEFAAMPDGAEKTGRAMELFGRSGTALIPMLNAGSAGIAEMRQEAHDLGLVLSNELVIAAEALNDDLTRLKGSLRGVANGLATELIPRIREVVGDFQNFTDELEESNVDLNMLAREGMDAVIEGAKIMAIAVLRSVEAVLFLRESYMLARDEFVGFVNTMGEIARHIPTAQFQIIGRLVGAMDLQVTDPATVAADISNMREVSGSLEALVGKIEAIGGTSSRARRAVREITDAMEDLLDIQSAPAADPDPLGPVRESAEEATSALEDLTSVMEVGLSVAYARAIDMSRKMGESMRAEVEIAKELRALAGQRKSEGNEKLLEASRIQAEMAEELNQIQEMGATAIRGLVSGLSGLSMAAVWEKDSDALRQFGLNLGKMLVQLGTMAVAYAGVAALATAFPVLAPILGNPAAAPGLAVAGLGAIAAGAALGATIPRGGGAPTAPGAATTEGPTTTTNIYQVSFDSLTPARARNRAMVESLGSSVESGA